MSSKLLVTGPADCPFGVPRNALLNEAAAAGNDFFQSPVARLHLSMSALVHVLSTVCLTIAQSETSWKAATHK